MASDSSGVRAPNPELQIVKNYSNKSHPFLQYLIGVFKTAESVRLSFIQNKDYVQSTVSRLEYVHVRVQRVSIFHLTY